MGIQEVSSCMPHAVRTEMQASGTLLGFKMVDNAWTLTLVSVTNYECSFVVNGARHIDSKTDVPRQVVEGSDTLKEFLQRVRHQPNQSLQVPEDFFLGWVWCAYARVHGQGWPILQALPGCLRVRSHYCCVRVLYPSC